MFQALDLTTVSKPTKSFTPLNLGATASAPPIAPAAPQGFFSNLVNGAKTLGQDVWSAFTGPAQNVQGPFSTTKPSVASDITLSTINSYANSLKEAGDRLSANQALFSDKTTSTPLERGISTVSAGIGVLGAFLAPLSAAGAGAEKIPVLGPIATGINNLFSAIGKGGADVAQGALYSLPFISDETKAKLSPLVQETGALAAQIAAGKAGGDVYDSFVAKTKELTARLSDHVAEVEKPTPSFEPLNLQKPVEAPALKADTSVPFGAIDERLAPLADKEGMVTVYRAASKFPTDKYTADTHFATEEKNARYYAESHYDGNPSDITIRSVKVPASLLKRGGSADSWQLKADYPVSSPSIPKELNTKSSKIGKSAENVNGETPTETPQVVSTRSDTLLKAAVEKKLNDVVKESGTHAKIDTTAQTDTALKFIKDNPDYMDVAMGRTSHPQAEAIYTAAEIKAIQEGDVAKINELSQSTVPTHAGQAMKALDSTDPNSPVKILRDIRKAREAKLENAPKKRAAARKQANQAIKGLNLDQIDLGKIESFIENNLC